MPIQNHWHAAGDKMKKIIWVLALLILVGSVSAQYWVTNPANCPTTYSGQSCSPNFVCGIISGSAQCASSVSLPAGPASSSTRYTTSLNGGYIINCYAADSGSPYCDNNGNTWCNANASCLNVNRQTQCSNVGWGVFTCGTCVSGYTYCDGSYTDADGCEIDIGTTSYPGESNAVYDASCNPQCSGSYLDCNGNLGSAVDGCEILNGGSCSVGSLTGVYQGCSGSAGNCVVSKSYFETGTLASYSSTVPLLRGAQYGGGWLFNLTNANSGQTLGINNSACIVFRDNTTQCSAAYGSGSGIWDNDTTNLFPKAGYPKNIKINNITLGNVSANNSIKLNGVNVCLQNGSNCKQELWQDTGSYLTQSPGVSGTINLSIDTQSDVSIGVASALITSDSSAGTSNNDDYAFDEDITKNWASGSGSFPHWIRIDLGSNKTVLEYGIYCNGPGPSNQDLNYSPDDWIFEASNDGITWTVIDTQTNKGWTKPRWKYFTITSPQSYRYYQINISDNYGTGNVAQIGEIDLYINDSNYLLFSSNKDDNYINYGKSLYQDTIFQINGNDYFTVTNDGVLLTNGYPYHRLNNDNVIVSPGGIVLDLKNSGGDYIEFKSSAQVTNGLGGFKNDTLGKIGRAVSGGGLGIWGISVNSTTIKQGLELNGVSYTVDNTIGTSGMAPVVITAYQGVGSNLGSFSNNDNIFVVRNRANTRMILQGDGDLYTDGTMYSAGYDYAEYFEGEYEINDSALIGLNKESGKVRRYNNGDILIGIRSTNPAIVGSDGLDANLTGKVLVGLVGQFEDVKGIVYEEDVAYTMDGKYRVGYKLSNEKLFLDIKEMEDIDYLKKENNLIKKALCEEFPEKDVCK